MSPAEVQSAYEELAELTERELECARSRRLTDLVDIVAIQQALIARLPQAAPAGAADALRRCQVLRAQIDAELARTREELVSALAAVRRGERVARGYAPAQRERHLVHADA